MNTVERFATAMVVERIVVGAAAIVARARCLPVSALRPTPTPCPALRPGCSGSATSLSAYRCSRPAGPDTTGRVVGPERDYRAHGSGRRSSRDFDRFADASARCRGDGHFLAVASGFLVLRRLASRP